jgi:polysaccharide export outer membrane protein
VAFGKPRLGLTMALCCAVLSGCVSSELGGMVGGTLSAPDPAGPAQEHRIAANDKLSIAIYPAKDLSIENARVDATGMLLVPAAGLLKAQGKTARELGSEIQAKLVTSGVRDPYVSVQVLETTSQQITIDGAVTQAGAYNLVGQTTLTEALTYARGPQRETANLKRVAVIRTSGGRRTGAIFNLEDIRAGRTEDPEIFGGDQIIVDSSRTKGAWRNMIAAIPFIGTFAAF